MEKENIRRWWRTHYSSEINPDLAGAQVTVTGWIKDIRDLGGIRFLVLQDKEGTVQVTVPRKGTEKEILDAVDSLQRQYCVSIIGVVKKMDKAPRGVEVIPKQIKVLGVAKQPLPLDVTGKTSADIDVRLDTRILDLLRDENRAIFKIRHVALGATRCFLSEKGFLEVNTPKIIASSTEGGAELFPIAYFEKEAFLAQSPQLYKEQLVIDFEKVFEIGPSFRADKSHTRRHLTEFISIDIEEAFATAEDVMQVAENLIHKVCEVVSKKCQKDLETLKHKIEVPQIPFERLSYDQIVNELREEGVKVVWGEDIPTIAYRTLGKIHPYFYFITDWPSSLKPFYIKPRDDMLEKSEGFDLMWHWIEIASGGTRVHDKELLIKRMKAQHLNPESFKHHLQAFDFGMPPHAGWAIGLERLVMMLTGIKNVREVVLFPRDRFRLTP